MIKDTDQYYCRHTLRRATQGAPFVDEKNPARAFTFSLFFWGAGQSYSGQRMRGVLFQIFMLVALIGIVFSLLFGKDLLIVLRAEGIFNADVFLAAEFLFLVALIFWIYNAVDAYHAAARARRVPFRGVRNPALPVLSSLLIPGWGQFMNGQPIKGSLLACLSVPGIFSVVTIPAALFCWQSLEASPARSIIEVIFAGTVLYALLIPIISILSSYDALKVSLDEMKKESMLDRFVLGMNRVRTQGWLRSLVPSAKSIVALAIILGLIITVKKNYHFSAHYIGGHLEGAEIWLHNQGMTLVPDLINRFVSGTVLAGN